MKKIIFFFCLVAFVYSSPLRILQILRLLSPECNNHGYLWKDQCFCIRTYTGPDCSQKKGSEFSDNTADKCDDLVVRLDNLYNISPDFYLFDDDEFPRIQNSSDAGWIKMHDISPNFHVFSQETSALDVGQGGLGDCYLLAAFASLANRNNGSVLKEMFVEGENDNKKHVYVTNWLINGKPRIVAVDDWVPGSGKYSWYSHVQADKDFWPVILEKAYAKIHGSYKIIEGGWQTAVWSGISQARTFNVWHNSKNASDLFDFLVDLFNKGYVVGAATVGQAANNEVGGHAYSVLGAYEVTLDNGSKVKLIRYFNPWHSEVWSGNPWGDSSANWTDYVKSQVPYLKGNDGIVFSTIEDYHANFGVTNWAEIHDNYDVSFIDIAFNFDDLVSHLFEVNFTYYGDPGHDLYIFNDQSNGRLLLGCSAPVRISGFSVIYQNGTEFKTSGDTIKISNAPAGYYTAKFFMKKNQKYVKYFTLTAYSQEGKLNFIPPQNNEIIDLQKKQCPNNCNLQGSCNTAEGACKCYFGYEGVDCGQIRNLSCINCSEYGVCDAIFGKCIQPGLYNLGSKTFLNEGAGFYTEMGKAQQWEILANGLVHNLNNNKYLDIAGGNLQQKGIITYSLNVPYSKNQLWNITTLDKNRFIISTSLNANLALAPASGSNRLTLAALNANDVNQQWSFAASSVSCPNDCSGHGVCSYSTGICVCGNGFVGDSCELRESPLQCPDNCSGHGVCDNKTGYCNCEAEYVGEDCSLLYRDTICPNNCNSNGVCSLDEGKCICNDHFSGSGCASFYGGVLATLRNVYNNLYLSVDSRRNLIFSNVSMNWNITNDNHLVLAGSSYCLDIAGRNYQKDASVILYWINSPTSDNQIWTLEKINDYFFIRSVGDQSFALTLRYDDKTITINKFNANDDKQKWKMSY